MSEQGKQTDCCRVDGDGCGSSIGGDDNIMDNVQATTININNIILECASGSTSTPTSCNILHAIQQQQQQDLVSSLSSSSYGRTNILIEVQQEEEQQNPLTSSSPTGSDLMFGFSVEPLSSSTPIQSGMVDVYTRRRNVSSPLTIQSSRDTPNNTNKFNNSNNNQSMNGQQEIMFRVGSPQSPVSVGPLLIEKVASPSSFAPSTLTPRSNPSSDEVSKQYSITAFIAKYQERIKQQQNIWKDMFMNLRVCVWSGLFVFVVLLTIFLFGLLAIFSAYASDNVEATKGQSMGISGTVTLLNKMHKLESKLYEYGHNRAIDFKESTTTEEEQYQYLESYFNCPRLDIIGVDIVGIYNYSSELTYLSACHNGKPIKPPKEVLTLPLDINKNNLQDEIIKSGYINVENPIIFLGTAEPHTNSTHILMISIMKTFGVPYVLMFGRYITLDRLEPISSFTSSCITVFNLRNQSELSLLGKSLGTSFEGNASNVFLQISNEIEVRYQYGQSKVFALDSNTVLLDDLKTDFRVCTQDKDLPSIISKRKRLVSYHMIPDFYGEYTVVLRSDVVREYVVIIWESCFLGIFVSWLFIFVSLVVMIFFIELFVIRRILVVSKFVKSIIQTSDFTKRLISKYKDEVGELTFFINGMLDVLDLNQKKLEKDNKSIKKLLERASIEEHKNRSVMNSVPELVAFIDACDGSIISANTSFESKIARKAKNSSQIYNIVQYLQEKLPFKDLLQKFDELLISETRWETNLLSSLSTPVPVSINITKSKVSNSSGKPVDTYVLVMKITEQKKDIRTALTRRRTVDEARNIEEFENMFNNPTLLSLFRIFLEKEKSAENLAFLEEVRAYKSTSTTIDRGKKQLEIISKYLEKSSNTFLNISHAVYESEYEKIKNGYAQLDLFDKLQMQITQLICADSFKRFSEWTLRPSSGRWSDATCLISE